MLKFKLTIFLIVILTSISFAQQANEIIGKYRLPNKLDVEIFEKAGKYFGKIIALNGFENGAKTDLNNPDKSKRNEPLIGKVIIESLEFDSEEKDWVNGSMYGPEKGMVFNLKITEIKQNEIVVVGSKYFFRKTIEWEKL